jgi:hypothetical protein
MMSSSLSGSRRKSVDGKERVLGRGADERDQAAFDVGEQHVLLALAEAVDLVEEQDRSLARVAEAGLGLVEDLADARDADAGGVLSLEVAIEVQGNDLGERRLAGAGRAVEEDAREAVGLEHAAEELAGAEDVPLAGNLVERAGTHPNGQGLDRPGRGVAPGLPQIRHSAGV